MSLSRRPLASLALLALATSPVVAQQGPPRLLVGQFRCRQLAQFVIY